MVRDVIVVEPGKDVRMVTVESLEDLQRLVGGYIECVPVSDKFTVWVNEEGMLHGMEPSVIWEGKGQVLVGPVVFDGRATRAGNTSSLKGNALKAATAYIEKNRI